MDNDRELPRPLLTRILEYFHPFIGNFQLETAVPRHYYGGPKGFVEGILRREDFPPDLLDKINEGARTRGCSRVDFLYSHGLFSDVYG